MKTFFDIPNFEGKIVSETNHFVIIYDGFPVNQGHILIISKNPVKDYFELSNEAQLDLNNALKKSKEIIEQNNTPDGYNIGMNCGEYAGQTVFHFHCHLIPRYKGDMDDPRGGVRHCVEGKGYY